MRNLLWVCVLVMAASAPALADDAKPEVRVKFEAHRGGVGAVAFSPSGELILTGSGNGIVRLWDAKTGEMQAKLDPFSGTKIIHAGFSADGTVMSVTARKSVMAWTLAEPKAPKFLFEDVYSDSASKVGGVSGDGKRIYYVDPDNGLFRFTDPKTNLSRLTDFKTKGVTPLAFAAAPDTESALAVVLSLGGEKSPALTFVGLGDSWTLTEGLKAPDASPNSVGFSPDGKWLVVCSGGSAQVWKVPGSQKVSGKPREVSPALAAAAGPNNLLAVAERPEGKKIRVALLDLSAEKPKAVTTYATDIDDVSCLAFSPDGKTLAVADDVEGVVQLWALPERK